MNSVQFKAPAGIRQSKVNEIIRTVEKRGITPELHRSLERDKRGWKWELAGLLVDQKTLQHIRKPRAAEAPAYENKTGIDLSSSEQQRITNLFVAKKFSEVLAGMNERPEVVKFVEYLKNYSSDNAISAKARELLKTHADAQNIAATVASNGLHDELVQIAGARKTAPAMPAAAREDIDFQFRYGTPEGVASFMITSERDREYVFRLAASAPSPMKEAALRAKKSYEERTKPAEPEEKPAKEKQPDGAAIGKMGRSIGSAYAEIGTAASEFFRTAGEAGRDSNGLPKQRTEVKSNMSEKEFVETMLLGGMTGTVAARMEKLKGTEKIVRAFAAQGALPSRLKNMAEHAIYIFEKGGMQDKPEVERITASEKRSIAGLLRRKGHDWDCIFRTIFGTDSTFELGRDPLLDARARYVEELNGKTECPEIKSNSHALLVKIGLR